MIKIVEVVLFINIQVLNIEGYANSFAWTNSLNKLVYLGQT